jgi:hypothetical protein
MHATIPRSPRDPSDALMRSARKRGSGLDQFEGRVQSETEAELRRRLGEDVFAASYAEGRVLALEDTRALRAQHPQPD